jgi:hypothetical protein
LQSSAPWHTLAHPGTPWHTSSTCLKRRNGLLLESLAFREHSCQLLHLRTGRQEWLQLICQPSHRVEPAVALLVCLCSTKHMHAAEHRNTACMAINPTQPSRAWLVCYKGMQRASLCRRAHLCPAHPAKCQPNPDSSTSTTVCMPASQVSFLPAVPAFWPENNSRGKSARLPRHTAQMLGGAHSHIKLPKQKHGAVCSCSAGGLIHLPDPNSEAIKAVAAPQQHAQTALPKKASWTCSTAPYQQTRPVPKLFSCRARRLLSLLNHTHPATHQVLPSSCQTSTAVLPTAAVLPYWLVEDSSSSAMRL